MSRINSIMRENLNHLGEVLKGIVIGAVQGIYTPVLMNTGVRQFVETIRYDKPEFIAKGTAQAISACFVHFPLAMYALEQRRELEYFGALAVTNMIDYLVHTHKHSKK